MNRWAPDEIPAIPEALAGNDSTTVNAASEGVAFPVRKSAARYGPQIYAAMMLLELLGIVGAFLVCGGIYFGQWPAPAALKIIEVFAPLYLTIAMYQRVYSIRAISDFRYAAKQIVVALIVATSLTLLFAFWAKNLFVFSRVTVTAGIITSFVVILALRALVIALVRKFLNPTAMNILVIHDGGPEIELPHAFHVDAPALGLSAWLDDPHGLDVLGQHVVAMDRVIISCPAEHQARWAFLLRASGVRGEIVTEDLQIVGAYALARYDSMTSLLVSTGPLNLRERAIKRSLDLTLTIPAILLLLPVFAAIALTIKLQDGGPVLFIQQRVGRGNRFFNIYKFRSMRVDRQDGQGARSASVDDDRVTAFGRFIRRTSLDELPQLFNVLAGDMSLVGPRPHAVGSRAGERLFWEIDREYWMRHSLKPGLTGLAQIRGFRGATDHEQHLVDRLQSDLEYVRNWTPLRDIAILFATIKVVTHDRAF